VFWLLPSRVRPSCPQIEALLITLKIFYRSHWVHPFEPRRPCELVAGSMLVAADRGVVSFVRCSGRQVRSELMNNRGPRTQLTNKITAPTIKDPPRDGTAGQSGIARHATGASAAGAGAAWAGRSTVRRSSR
jgi:hypothetical protein